MIKILAAVFGLLIAACVPFQEIEESNPPPIIIKINEPPIVDAGRTQYAKPNDFVVLMGNGTRDPNGDNLTWSWVQTEGPEVELFFRFSSITEFMAPSVDEKTILRFSLIVSDGHVTAHGETAIVVEPL